MKRNRICASRNRQAGFTLVELMITVAIVAILAAVALPSYQEHVRRGHRAAAQAEMMDIANRQQQHLMANRQYADSLAALSHSLPASVDDRYTVAINAANDGTPPTFLITFTPKGAQAADGVLTLNSAGVKMPAEKW